MLRAAEKERRTAALNMLQRHQARCGSEVQGEILKGRHRTVQLTDSVTAQTHHCACAHRSFRSEHVKKKITFKINKI